MESNDTGPLMGRGGPASRLEQYQAAIQRVEGGPNECTIFPSSAADIPDDEEATTWISAEEPAYLDLTDCR